MIELACIHNWERDWQERLAAARRKALQADRLANLGSERSISETQAGPFGGNGWTYTIVTSRQAVADAFSALE